MSCGFFYFMERLGLLDRYFETTAEKLIFTRSEWRSLEQLTRRGYVPTRVVRRLQARGLIEPSRANGRAGAEDVDRTVQTTVAAYRSQQIKFIIVEDDVLRTRLAQAGVRVITTPDVIFQMAKRGALSRAEAAEALEGLRLLGWHSASVIERIKAALPEVHHAS